MQVSFSLVFEFLFCWGILLGRDSFLFGQHKTKKPTTNNKPGVWWTEGVGFGISSIASSSLGDRKKGYPKRQALWELTLALGRFPFVFEFFWDFLCFFIDFNRFWWIFNDFDGFLMILGSDFDILGFLTIWGTCAG